MNHLNDDPALTGITFLFGMSMGAIVASVLITMAPGLLHYEVEQAIAKCEAQLPRDMHCVVTAAPE